MTALDERDALDGYADERSADWLAMHIFYTASARPLIGECIAPLTQALREEGLIRGYFFINYWLEGPHVRLRVLPAAPDVVDTVKERVEEAVQQFLDVRPALFEVTNDALIDYYETLFSIEYPGGDRKPYEDENGRMRLRDNNTFSWENYAPEYDRYGGEHGMALCEAHFAASSDLVVSCIRQMNVHLRTVRLGVSLQLMLVIATIFLGYDSETIAHFFKVYGDNWKRDFTGTDFINEKGYAREYALVTTRTRNRWLEIAKATDADGGASLGSFLHKWAVHCTALREEIVRLADDGKITFPAEPGAEPEVVDAPTALRRLLGSFIHMTNNRIATTIGDEAYLSHIIHGGLATEEGDAEEGGSDSGSEAEASGSEAEASGSEAEASGSEAADNAGPTPSAKSDAAIDGAATASD